MESFIVSSPKKFVSSEECNITVVNSNQVQSYAEDCTYSACWNTSHSNVYSPLMTSYPPTKETSLRKSVKTGRSKMIFTKHIAPGINMELEGNDCESDTSSSIAEENIPMQNYEIHEFRGRGRGHLMVCASQGEEDYRRFSSRLKKKTSFFGVSAMERKEMKTYSQEPGQMRKGTRSRSALRKLDIADNQLGNDFPQHRPQAAISIDLCLVDIDQGTRLQPDTNSGKNVTTDVATVPASSFNLNKFKETYCIGRLVWGKLPQYVWWPGSIVSYGEKTRVKQEPDNKQANGPSDVTQVWIKWFGENQLSKVSLDKVTLFDEFEKYYSPLNMKGIYKKAVLEILKEAAKRCKMTFVSFPNDETTHGAVMENSLQVSLPRKKSNHTIPSSIMEETEETKGGDKDSGVGSREESVIGEEEDGSVCDASLSVGKSLESASHKVSEAKPNKKRRGKGLLALTSYEEQLVEWALKRFLPMGSDGLLPTPEDQMRQVCVVTMDRGESGEDGDGPPKKRAKVILMPVRKKANFESVWDGKLELSSICIGCGDLEITNMHPLFNGGYCTPCKDLFMECAYLFDDDGSQMYCTICSGGEKVFMCDAENCSKVYCEQCINKLCGQEEVERVDAADHWLCYMCCPTKYHVGFLAKREDWDIQLRQLFLNDNKLEFDPPLILPPIPPELRRPLRVLGLFDGIGTGLLVLKELGIEAELYVSSEVDRDAVNVSRVRHVKSIHVGDIRNITEKEVRAWGPFDLVFGGSPCNDLSIVNPARKGIYDGTGRLFFEFFRILSIVKPTPDEDRLFFWLFENVVSMRPQDKEVICRFLQCNPVVVDAKEISPAHRARYFWGNLPGMNRPMTPLPSDRLTLQDCLETNCFRVAQFTKLRTITTKMNSIKQCKGVVFPVKVEGQEEDKDVLWCTEMERLFGFPDHYTDVGNLGRSGRQRLLGKAWSVPVIRHLLAPLKDYFTSSKSKDLPNGDKKANTTDIN